MKLYFLIVLFLVTSGSEAFAQVSEAKLFDIDGRKNSVLNLIQGDLNSISKGEFKSIEEMLLAISEKGHLAYENAEGGLLISSVKRFHALPIDDVIQAGEFPEIKGEQLTNIIKIKDSLNTVILIDLEDNKWGLVVIKSVVDEFIELKFSLVNNQNPNKKSQVIEFLKNVQADKKIVKIDKNKSIVRESTVSNCRLKNDSGFLFNKNSIQNLPIWKQGEMDDFSSVKSKTDLLYWYTDKATLRFTSKSSTLVDGPLLKNLISEKIAPKNVKLKGGFYVNSPDELFHKIILSNTSYGDYVLLRITSIDETKISFQWLISEGGDSGFLMSDDSLKEWLKGLATEEQRSTEDKFKGFTEVALLDIPYEERDSLVKEAIGNGHNINEKKSKGNTPLIEVSLKSTDSLLLLLRNGADPNAYSDYGWTALHCCAKMGKVENCKALIKQGADSSLKSTKEGLTALQFALKSRNKNTELINLLSRSKDLTIFEIIELKKLADLQQYIESGRDLNLLNSDGESSVNVAVRVGAFDILKLLLDNKADQNVVPRNRLHPFVLSANLGHVQMVDLFLTNGGIQEPHLNKALYFASFVNNHEVCSLLLENGANPEMEIKRFGKALNIAMRRGGEQLIQTYLDHGYSIPFWSVCKNGMTDLAKERLESKNTLELKDDLGRTALHYSVLAKDLEVTNLILKEKLLLDEIDPAENNTTALHHAAKLGTIEIIKALLDHGANVNAIANSKRTALYYAVVSGNEQAVNLLLERGADPNIYADHLSENPLIEYAKMNQKILSALRKYNAN